jgi:hypothetical protein
MTLTVNEMDVLLSLRSQTRMMKYKAREVRRLPEWRTLLEADLAEVKTILQGIFDEVEACEQILRETRCLSCVD